MSCTTWFFQVIKTGKNPNIQSTFRVGTLFLFGEYLSWPARIACFSSLSSPALLRSFAVWCWPRGINEMCSTVVFVSLWDIPEDNAGLLLLLPPFLFATWFCLVTSRSTTVGDELCKVGAIWPSQKDCLLGYACAGLIIAASKLMYWGTKGISVQN